MKFEMEMLAGVDIGNAKTEVVFLENGELKHVRQPSVVSLLSSKPDDSSDMEEVQIVKSLTDNLSVNIFSKGLKYDGMYYVGNKALSSNKKATNMGISLGQKSTQDIPLITPLSLVAAIALQTAYKQTNKIPKTIDVTLQMVTAIPSSEYNNNKKSAKDLEERFLHEHTINLNVGEENVIVTINVKNIKVTEEGKTAMLAFLNSDPSILRHFNETYKLNATPADFSDSKSLHADIGDGTSEFVFTHGYTPVPNSSHGEILGVGHATNEAIEMYRKEMNGLIGKILRQQFIETLSQNTDKAEIAKEQMEKATKGQAIAILESIIQSFSEQTSSSADYFFVHGGGSIVFKEQMYKDLLDFAAKVSGKVVWIPEEYATTMISRGNFYLAEALFGDK